MVATSGLTRSKGRVSQAGKTSTRFGPAGDREIVTVGGCLLPGPADERLEVVGQLLGGGSGGRHHQHRPAGAQADQAGDQECLGRGGHGQRGGGRADDPGHGGLVAQQWGKRAQAHRTGYRGRPAIGLRRSVGIHPVPGLPDPCPRTPIPGQRSPAAQPAALTWFIAASTPAVTMVSTASAASSRRPPAPLSRPHPVA